MYLMARSWGIQPSEFWEMTIVEFMLEARFNYEQTPQGRAVSKKEEWLAAAEMTDEEWWAEYGTSKD